MTMSTMNIEHAEQVKKSKPLWKHIRTFWRKHFGFESEGLMCGHRMYGKFYVAYPDGQRSQRMGWKCANDYRDMFGGEVKEVDDE